MRYESIPAVNWSSLKHMRVSPLQYQHELTRERKDTDAFRMGRAIHALVLEPQHWDRDFAVWDGAARRGAAWDTFAELHRSRTILTAQESRRAKLAAMAVRSHPVARQHLRDGVAEHTIQWVDAETGVECKGRVDAVNGHLVELKTAADIDPVRFASAAARYGYHAQLAFYFDGLAALGHQMHEPAMIVVESDEPHDVLVYAVDEGVLEAGRALYRRLLRRLVACRESGSWPGRCEGEMALVLPAWAEADDEADEPITMGGIAIGF